MTAESFNLSESVFSYYVLFNWACLFLSAILLLRLFLFKKSAFVKPSVLLLTYTHAFLQWPATIYSSYYEQYLPHPLEFALIIHGYVLIGIFLSMAIFRRDAALIWSRICSYKGVEYPTSKKAIVLLTAMVVTIVFIYLKFIPLQNTGLYVMLSDPLSSEISNIAREESLKLLDNVAIIYAYTILTSSIAPLLTVMLALAVEACLKKYRFFSASIATALIGFTIFTVSLTGARVSAANLLFVIAIVFMFKNRLSINPLKLVLAISTILMPAVLLSMLREGKSFDYELLPMYFGFIARRLFLIPLDVGSWYVHYLQTVEPIGIQAIPKLAPLFGVAPIDVPNYIAVLYDNWFSETSSASAGYIFSYYSYMGIISLPVTLAGILFLDVALLIYKRLSDFILLPCVAAISLSTLAFVSADFSAVFVTHGFAIILVLSLLIDYVVRLMTPPSPEGQKHLLR